jgi:hypothetical protein
VRDPFHFEEATLSWKVLLLITRCLGLVKINITESGEGKL